MHLDIVVFRDEDAPDFYNAICLQMDIVACGKTVEEAVRDLAGCMAMQATDCIAKGDVANMWRDAPQEYWDMRPQGDSDGFRTC